MLGSDHEGERANAARLATLELKRLGLTWAELIARAFRATPKAEPPPKARQEPPRGASPFGPNGQANWHHGWGPRQPPDWWFEQQRRTQQQQQPNPGQRWSEKHGFKLWDIVVAADLNWNGDELLDWDRDFITTFKNYGPTASATTAQWVQLVRIAKKLGMQPAKA